MFLELAQTRTAKYYMASGSKNEIEHLRFTALLQILNLHGVHFKSMAFLPFFSSSREHSHLFFRYSIKKKNSK